MKNNLLIKPLAVVLSGTMLFGAGCKDYDDDIASLNDRIEELNGKIELKADASVLQSLKEKIDAIDFTSFVTNTQLSEELAKYVKEAELDSKVGALGYIKTSALDELLESAEFETAVKAICDNQIQALDIWGSIKTDVETAIQNALDEYSISQADINTVIAAVIKQIDDDPEVTDIKTAIKNMLGKEYGEVLNDYVTIDDLDASVANELADPNSELKASILALIEKALDGEGNANSVWLAENDLATVFAAYQKQIEGLWSAVGNLASRIQSLVYVPTTADGVATFQSASLGDVKLTEGQKATMTFRVSPASLASALVAGYENGTVELSFLPEKVTRAEAEPAFAIEGPVTATEDGKISMLVNSTYEYTDTETYAIALQVISESKVTRPNYQEDEVVAMKVAEGEDVDTGIAFTSAYVPTTLQEDDVLNHIALVKAEKVNDKYVAYDENDGAEYSIEYNNVEGQYTLLGDYIYVYADGNEMIDLEAAQNKFHWDVLPEATPAIARTAFNDADATGMAITPEDPMEDDDAKAEFVTIGIKTPAVANIDKVITENGKLYVTVGEEKVSLNDKTYKASLKITRKSLGTIEAIDGNIDWIYARAEYTNEETGDFFREGYANQLNLTAPIFIDKDNSVLSKEQYEGIKTSLKDAVWEIEIDESSDEDFEEMNGGLTVSAIAVSNPYVGTDSKVLQYKVQNYKNGNGTIHVSTKINVNDNEEVTLKGTITFNGLPNMTYDITNADAEIASISSGNMWVDIADKFYTTMYAKLPAGSKYFASVEEFKQFMNNAPFNVGRQDADATKYIAEASLRAVANGDDVRLRAFFKTNSVDFSVADAYSYTAFYTKEPAANAYFAAPANTQIFKIEVVGTITIKKQAGYYLGAGANLFQGADIEVPYMIAKGKINTNNTAFEVTNVDLTSGYSKRSDNGATGNAVVTYSLITTEPDGYTGNLPTIDGGISGTDGVFSWNGCQLDEVEVEAVLTVDGVTTDTKTFKVVLEKPINFGWTFAQKTQSVEINTMAEVNLYAVMNTKVSNKNVALDIFGNNLLTDTGLAANVADDAYYGLTCTFGTPKYESTNGAETFDNFSFANGVITYAANNAPLAGVVTVTVDVTFTYKYAVAYNADTRKYEPVKFTMPVTVKFQNK